MKLPLFLRKYFWDTDFNALDPARNSSYVIVRLLEHGDVQAIRWLSQHMSKRKMKEVIVRSRELSRRSANFWSLILHVDKEQMRCMKKSYQKMQRSHWPY